MLLYTGDCSTKDLLRVAFWLACVDLVCTIAIQLYITVHLLVVFDVCGCPVAEQFLSIYSKNKPLTVFAFWSSGCHDKHLFI